MTAPEPPTLRVDAVSLVRGDRSVLEALTWSWGPGGIAWVTGPNGAGKTTLLRALAGLAPPEAGTVELRGARADRRRVVYYHPSMGLPGDVPLPAWESLAGGLVAPADAADGVDLVPATAHGRRRWATLSTGEAKRALLETLLRVPASLTVLDEPYEHLSDGAKDALTALLRRRARDGVVVVATNQDPDVGRGTDAVLRLEPGRSRANLSTEGP